MSTLTFSAAVDAGLAAAMAEDARVVTFGEDVRLLRRDLLVRFGPDRVRDTPISEAAFVHAGVAAAAAGLRPVVEVMLVDFLPVAWSALVNAAALFPTLSAGAVRVPVVVRAACGGGYGDAGQHEQALWGMIGSVPGLTVVVPSTPADAAGLMLAAVQAPGPVVFLEHKLLTDYWLDYLGGASRPSVAFDVPEAGRVGEVPDPIRPVALGSAALRRPGGDVLLVSLGVGVHRCLAAAEELARAGTDAAVVDLRSAAPLDVDVLVPLARRCGRVVVVDEDYLRGGLSGEVAAVLLEAGLTPRFARVATPGPIPFARDLEAATLPSVGSIVAAVERLA